MPHQDATPSLDSGVEALLVENDPISEAQLDPPSPRAPRSVLTEVLLVEEVVENNEITAAKLVENNEITTFVRPPRPPLLRFQECGALFDQKMLREGFMRSESQPETYADGDCLLHAVLDQVNSIIFLSLTCRLRSSLNKFKL